MSNEQKELLLDIIGALEYLGDLTKGKDSLLKFLKVKSDKEDRYCKFYSFELIKRYSILIEEFQIRKTSLFYLFT